MLESGAKVGNNGADRTAAETAADPNQLTAKDGESMAPTKRTTSPAFQFYAPKFWRKVNKTDTCWLWTASVDSDGYGQFWAGKNVRAHRFAFEVTFGWMLPDGIVMHKCDTPRCVRPDHLVLGTTTDNVRDKIRKGRLVVPHGAEHWSRRLSMEQIREAREMWWSGSYTQREIAAKFSVSNATMNRAIRQLAWEERNA